MMGLEVLVLMLAALPGMLWIVDGYCAQVAAARTVVPMTTAEDAALRAAFVRAMARREMTSEEMAADEALRRALAR